MSAHPELPCILVGLGEFGTRVVERVIDEQAHGEQGNPPVAAICVERRISPTTIAERVRAEARELLAHRRIAPRRDEREESGLSRLHVFVIAGLGETEVRRSFADSIQQIEHMLLSSFGPIFEAYRVGSDRNLVILPLCAMPHPAASPDGEELATDIREFCRRLAATDPRKRAIPQFFLIEDVAEFSVLGDQELAQCVRNFLTLLVYSIGSISRIRSLLYGESPNEPLATFVCATSEIPRDRLRVYARDRVALEMVGSVLDATTKGIDLREIDALEEVEFVSFDAKRDADRDVLELLQRYAPGLRRDPEPQWWVRGESLLRAYGPDVGDRSIVRDQPPADPPIGWAKQRMREIEASWRKLQRRRFDDVIGQERARIQKERDELKDAIHRRVDDSLWADPSPEAFRKTGVLVSRMERAISIRLEDAIRDRDEALPVPPPSFDAFRDAHSAFLDEARRKPDLARMGIYGLLFVSLCTFFGRLPLRALADALRIVDGDWAFPWLYPYGWLTSLLVGSIGAGVFLGLRYRTRHLALRTAFHNMFDALDNTVTGLRDSVLEYFASRLRMAREVARVEGLLSIRSQVLSDQRRLKVVDRAARRARSTLLASLSSVGVEYDHEGREDISPLVGVSGEVLVESMLPRDSQEYFDRLLPSEEKEARVRDTLFRLARDQGYRRNWRTEVPFTDLEPIRAVSMPYAEPIAAWDPLSSPKSAASAATQLAEFARRQARSLHVALNISGHEAADASGQTTALDGELIVPPRAFDEVRRLLSERGAGGRAQIPVQRGHESDRAYYVVAIGDIDQSAVASLSARGEAESEERSDLRFEIETETRK